MVTKRNGISVLILGLLVLLTSQSTRLYASSATIPETMTSCEDLLGKSTSAVLAKFGPPDTAEIVPKDSHTTGPGSSIINSEPELLIWMYQKISPPHTVMFLFSNKLLIAVTWNPTVYSAIGIDQVEADAESLIKEYKRTSLKLGYSGGAMQNNPLELRELTQNGHLARFFCNSDLPPLVTDHVFNPETGLYSDKIEPNPKFSLSQRALGRLNAMILTNGQGETYELDAKETRNRMSTVSISLSSVTFV